MVKNRLLMIMILGGLLCTGCQNGRTQNVASTEDSSVAQQEQTNTQEMVQTDATDGEDQSSATTEWSVERLKRGKATAIEYDKKYDANIKSEQAAIDAIAKYGDMQRENYSNPEAEEIERKMEQEFQLAAVTLGEMDLDTAQDVYTGCAYIFQTYPHLKGFVTDITLGNLDGAEAMALTRHMEFIRNGEDCPIVVKHEVILDAATFLDREKLLNECSKRSESGFWPKNSKPSKIIVHELGHCLLDDYVARKYDVRSCFITEDKLENFIVSENDQLASFQNSAHEVMDAAYQKWLEKNQGTEEEFRGSISEYANGVQYDGGISLTETIAEAVSDIYLNGDAAAEASKIIVDELMSLIKETM